jgi:hypothetical protein
MNSLSPKNVLTDVQADFARLMTTDAAPAAWSER